LKNGEVKITVDQNGKYQATSNGATFNAALSVSSVYRSIDGFLMSVSHKHTVTRDTIEGSTEFKGQLEPSQPYSLKTTLYQKSSSRGNRGGVLNYRVTLNTPLFDFKTQEIALNSEYNDREAKISANLITGNGKKVTIKGDALPTSNGGSVSFQVDSDLDQISHIKVNGNYHRQSTRQMGFSGTILVDGEQLVDLNGNINANNMKKANALISANTAWTPRYDLSANVNVDSDLIKYELVANQESIEMFAAKVNGRSRRNGWTGECLIVAQGSQLIRVDLEHDQLPSGEMNYVANYKGPIEPISITYKLIKDNSGRELIPTLRLCRTSQGSACFSIHGFNKNDNGSNYSQVDRMAGAALMNVVRTLKMYNF